MQVQVRYFAIVRERLGREGETIELANDATVAALVDLLSRRHEAVRALRRYLTLAVNREVVGPEAILRPGDEVALIPPVAGGDGTQPRLARIAAGQGPSLTAVIAAARSDGAGGIVTFVGVVRDHSAGRPVQRLEYEAYPEMAEQVFRRLCDEIEAELPGVRLAVEHATGSLAVGDTAVVIAASAPHRGEAFRACQLLIDRLKAEAPIWKKEIGPDGSSWVGIGP